MSYKAILFDLDGTLLNTLDDIGYCTNQVLLEKGFPEHDIDSYRFFVGEGAAMLFRKALPEHQRTEINIQACVKDFTEIYGQQGRSTKITIYSGIRELLDKLNKSRIKTTILSNKPHELTKKSVTDFLSQWEFDIVLGQRNKVPRKPDPAGAIEIAQHLDILPSEFLYLGDTAIDMKTAVSAEMFPVGALWGFREKEELLENGARALIDHPLALIDLLEQK